MGRSKFPGKPSKSINRKRISVLQLDPNNTLTAAAATATAAAATASNATTNNLNNSTGAATTAATATANTNATSAAANAEDDEEQTKKEENINYDSAEVEKRKNGKKEEDDDEDDNGGPATAGGGGAVNASKMNGRASVTAPTNQQQQQKQQQNSTTTQNQQQNAKLDNVTTNHKKNLTISADSAQEFSENPTKSILSPSSLAKEMKKLHHPSSSSSLTSSSVTVQHNFSKRPCKKFKNLNINKPEVMLPSSGKLKLQQQEQQQQREISTSSTATTPVPLNNFPTSSSLLSSSASSTSIPEQNDSQPINNELLLSTSSSSACVASLTTPQQRLTSSTTSSPSSSSCNFNEYHKSVNHNNTTDHKINDQPHNNNDDEDDGNQRINDDKHNNNDDVVDDENSSLTFPTTSSQLEMKKLHQKSSLDVSTTTLSNGTSDLQNEDSRDATNNDDNRNIIKQSPSLTTPLNSPSRTMDHTATTTTNGSLTSSPSRSNTNADNPKSAAATANLNSNSNSCSSSGSDKKQKKTVTFKNVLETSDDKSAVKKFYNPDNRKPLVSIIKKECLNRPLLYTRNSECIVRPSRLTEILKNNSNIDKLNSLKFRSNHSLSATAGGSTESTESNSVLEGPLSRVFGAPSEKEESKQKHNIINFRLSKDLSDDDDEEEDEEEEENSDDDEKNEDYDEQDDTGMNHVRKKSDEEDEEEEDHEEDTKLRNGQLKLELEPESKLKLKSLVETEEEEQQMVVDNHFVLPKRSRSSRIIKPNKRLIEDGIICKKSILKSATTLTQNSSLTSSNEDKLLTVTTQQQPNYFSLGDYNDEECNGIKALKSPKDLSTDSAKLASTFSSITKAFSNFVSSSTTTTNSSNSGIANSTTKPSSFVLRQPRLQFESPSSTTTTTSERINNSSNSVAAAAAALALSASLPKSLQHVISSSSSAVTASSSLLSPTFSLNAPTAIKTNNTTITCSPTSPPANQCTVCSSIIHSKNLSQANKYVEPSCEHCRKFISKIAKKSLAMKNSTTMKNVQLQCKADGSCVITPLNNKAGHLKNFKKVYKERCGYCWLKKCLQTLQLPKVRLNAVLPVLSSGVTSSNNSTSKFSLQDTKTKKEIIEETTKITAPLKWKPSLMEPSMTATAVATVTNLTDGAKLNLKTNPLAENNVTFGSVPLLRPAILDNPLFTKTSPFEAKQEKPEKKPLDVLKDLKTVKTEPLAVEAPTQVIKTFNKRKDKSGGEKERKEVRMKEMLSPKTEMEKVKEVKEKQENLLVNDLKETKQEEVSVNNNSATNMMTGLSSPTSTSNAGTLVSSNDKRQRIDLKGPRVKHVCRSASIVLGQPLAMFGEDGEETVLTEEEMRQQQQSLQPTEAKISLTDENDNCASCKPQQLTNEDNNSSNAEPPLKTAKIEKIEPTIKAVVPVSKLSQRPHHYNTQLTAYKKQINSHIHPSLQPPRARKEPQLKCKLLISIDFWENYDPAEVCQTGFGLIVTEAVAQRALCFLCGSAGQEPLIFCSCCCEPYHQYCVQDEFNLKHGSLDDTMLLNESCLSVTGLGSNANTAIAKLNWLCPRCTVCYTCNMSSGAKVKCQKCQKNYHSTCLGTSKRLLGADRPLICVNCLKCRSCSTTKVTKFVGNLPMCTNCFKLRKKGNYCPICQKCYDDQDFDLKMMECGDCNQWVHAKCETLTDEQYNLLSTLPESIEFICKRCSRKSQDAKQRASEWREAVKEEFKSSLMSVLKLLSKSRQACALLKLSPRKQLKCSCNSSSNTANNNKFQPKSLQFCSQQEQHLASNESETSNQPSANIDIYEFDDRERDQVILNHSPGDVESKKCQCQTQMSGSGPNSHLSLVEIKQKIALGSYVSLAEFNYDMNLVIQQANCDDLVIVYKEILSEQFPWFQNETQACTDALEEDMYESAGGAYGLNTSIDSESDYNMDCLPSSQEQQDDHDRSALLAELPHDLEDLLYGIKSRSDARICLFCRRTGEGLPGEESRLLYCGHDCWVHTNCALWSAEVFEEIDGSLQNVHSAVARGRMIKCSVCGNRGATVGCNVKACGEHYHYPCARAKNCAFLADKSMYCPQHANSLSHAKTKFETQFEVTRPVYVELERKRKKLVEPSKVQFHIGSLEVKQLGHILPRFSDTYEALVPINFLCSRLYWSYKEPWKIVEYTVRTYIYNNSSSTLTNGAIDLGKNFTVDHTQTNPNLIQLGLTQIQQWHLSLAKGDYETAEEYDYLNSFPQHSLGTASNNTQETNANNDEEPQTNADLLPPEIKDAIFEDLPGDLLEGISMLDIFTKCMNYEDMAHNEQSKDGVTTTTNTQQPMSDEDTMTSIGTFTKQLTAELNGNWSGAANHNHVEDALLSTTTVSTNQAAIKLQKLKKSSSPVINCDVNTKHAIKRRKISENMLLTLNNHQRSQKKEGGNNTRRLDYEQGNKRTFTWSAEKRYNLDQNQTEQKIKLMQMDGVDDSITEFRFITQESTQTAVKCERCQCTYRNIESFQRHLNNCEPMSSSTSESESEHNSQTPDNTHNTTQALTLEQLQELNNKLQQQQRTQQMPYIQSIPTQTLSQLQGLQTANILQGVQLQGVQNLQNLHNIQQLTQAQPLGGNFFISTAQPEINQASPELQLYANTLQGLTANLNGTFTLQPAATTQYTNANQLQANQPQLLAVHTNPDGSQQIIQLPTTNTQPQAHTPATYQTLQATNTDKKIVLPLTQGKPLKTMATKAAQQAAAKNKLKATTVVKPIQSKINNTTTNHLTQPQTVNATQLLNQQILQQLQQQAQQNTNQPQLLFQAAQPQHQQQPQIIMQQPQNIISFVTTTNEGTGQPQLQYVALPAAQQPNEFKPQTQASLFTTANTQPLLQSAYLQTDASGNLVLTNAPPQQPAPLQLITTPQGSQVIGTLIQPSTIQLQGGNVITTTTTATAEQGIPQQGTGQTQQQQVIISGNPGATTNGLEMLTAATTPQVILATTTQPMYYGLETIVQNTVMSSQQFVSTAMPGVLSQNASFSATTTQVFQASKIEPLVDIPAGYVLLNNVDANNALMQTQQATSNNNAAQQQATQNNFIQAALQQQAQALAEQQQQQQQQAQNNVFRLQTPPVTTTQGFQLQTPSQIVVTQQTQPQAPPTPVPTTQFVEATQTQPSAHLISAKVAPVAQVKRTKTAAPVAAVTKVQPQVVNKVMPNVVQVTQPAAPQKVKIQNTPMPQTALGSNLKTTNATHSNSVMQQTTQLNQPTEVSKSQTMANQAVTAAISTTTNKKTNMIKPLHKLEVKPKVMKTAAAATVVTKTTNNNSNETQIIPPLNQIQTNITNPTAPSKMIVLKPQQQQQQQQQHVTATQPQTQQQQQQQQQPAIITNNTATNLEIPVESNAAIIPLTNLTETNENTEFMNLQHVASTHQQHYNVADALLLDDSSQINQQNLSHCSFSNTTNNYETVQQTATAATGSHNSSENVNNILPTIQRMPQYTNINIVNPLQQYSNTNTLTTSTSTTSSSTTITRPTNRVLPMQQRQYEQHSQTNCTTTTSSSSSAVANTNITQFSHASQTNSQISQQQTGANTQDSNAQQTAFKENINKIAYEAEVKQMLLHSPQPAQDSQQVQHTQLQQVMHLQHESLQHNLAKSSPPPLSYDIVEKPEDNAQKMCLHDLNYVHNGMTEFVDTTGSEQCLITDPKFPPEGEVLLGTECCENEEHLSTTNNEEDEVEGSHQQQLQQQLQEEEEEEEDDGFSLKMPSADGSDNMSMDSDEPAVKEKISKILDNLTNEDCTDSLNTSTTIEAQVEMACNSQYLNAALNQENLKTGNDPNSLTPQEANAYYTATTEETSAFIAAQLAAESMKESQANEDYSALIKNENSNKLEAEVINPLNTNYIPNCSSSSLQPASNINNLQEQQQEQTHGAAFSEPLTMAAIQPPPHPPSRDPKRVTGPHLLYEIQSEDGFTYKSSSITEVWEKVFEAVQVARRAHGLAPLPEGPLADMSGVQMIGLKTNALKYLIEQLPGVEKCSKYTPKYHRRNGSLTPSHTASSSSLSSSSSMNGNASVAASIDTDSSSIDYASDQEDLAENLFECARCEPFSKRSEYDMFSWLASRHRKQPVQVFVQPSDNELVPRRGTGSNLPMAMKYRTLKETYKDYVGVFRSHIHGRGLYCTKDIEAGEMVIEYAGELIRSTLTDQRERYYNSRGIGCYMFKIDEHLVVDATMRGNAARFINHSCEPNCYSKVVDILGHKHIIIFALRRIVQGEELTYDYKFPFEDEKIPCSCGSKRCRKYLN